MIEELESLLQLIETESASLNEKLSDQERRVQELKRICNYALNCHLRLPRDVIDQLLLARDV